MEIEKINEQVIKFIDVWENYQSCQDVNKNTELFIDAEDIDVPVTKSCYQILLKYLEPLDDNISKAFYCILTNNNTGVRDIDIAIIKLDSEKKTMNNIKHKILTISQQDNFMELLTSGLEYYNL